jgi:hypothetical protein
MDVWRRSADTRPMKEVALWTALSAALAVGAVAFEMRREIVPLWRLSIAPLAALACALSLPPEPRWLGAALGAVVVGLVAGSVRGLSATLRVDRAWRAVSLRYATFDGIAVALVIALMAGADIKPVVAYIARELTPPPFAAIALLGAGYLLGRAASIGVRSGAQDDDPVSQ